MCNKVNPNLCLVKLLSSYLKKLEEEDFKVLIGKLEKIQLNLDSVENLDSKTSVEIALLELSQLIPKLESSVSNEETDSQSFDRNWFIVRLGRISTTLKNESSSRKDLQVERTPESLEREGYRLQERVNSLLNKYY